MSVDAHEQTARILARDKVCLLRRKITHKACHIFWLTIVLDRSPGYLLLVMGGRDCAMRRHAMYEMGQLTLRHHFTDSSSNCSATLLDPSKLAATLTLIPIQHQKIMLTLTHWGFNNTRSIRIHRDVVSPKFQR